MGESKSKRSNRGPVNWTDLATAAEKARAQAYAPYSKYRVGAALWAARPGESPRVYAGANMENGSYPLSVCAERHAIAAAIHAGATDFRAMAIATQGPTAGSPCGACRQVMAEFAEEMKLAMVVDGRVKKKTTLTQLLPMAFRARSVGLLRPGR
jgi:cytidine deaminase